MLAFRTMSEPASSRVCPECDLHTNLDICPKCGSRTLRDRQAEAAPDPMPGKVLEGRYRIESLVGRGGMGAVYRGVQLATKQIVAIKIIRSEHTRNLDAAKRFHREARAASLLTHPHTIRVFDFGESEDGDLFMVLEFLNGRTLGRLMKAERRLAAARVAKIACEVAQALTEAHANGLVHRDLKPENVMLLDSYGDPDFVKVLDFGIAKFLSGDSGQSSVTGTGMIVGTPHYMAPEQASGSRALSTAIDVYALGVMVHEALTGTKPFDGETPLVVMMAHLRNPLPEMPPELDIPQGLRELLARMLAKDPAARPSAAEVAASMERIRLQALVGAVAQDVSRAGPVEPAGATRGAAAPRGGGSPVVRGTLVDPLGGRDLPSDDPSAHVILEGVPEDTAALQALTTPVEPWAPVPDEDPEQTRIAQPPPAAVKVPAVPTDGRRDPAPETEEAGGQAARAPDRRRTRPWVLVILLLALAFGGGVAWVFLGASDSSPGEPASVTTPEASPQAMPETPEAARANVLDPAPLPEPSPAVVTPDAVHPAALPPPEPERKAVKAEPPAPAARPKPAP